MVAIARPAAPRLYGAYPTASESSAIPDATSDIRPVAFGTAAPRISPDRPNVATCAPKLLERATAHNENRYSSPEAATAAPTANTLTASIHVEAANPPTATRTGT